MIYTYTTIYIHIHYPVLDDVSSSFQTRVLARDCYPLKLLAIHKKLSYKLALRACPRKITRRSAIRYSEPSGTVTNRK
jgi:hypothetical protein